MRASRRHMGHAVFQWHRQGHVLGMPLTLHDTAEQHAPTRHEDTPAQLTVQSFPPQVTFWPPHELGPVHSMSHLLAEHAMPPVHAPDLSQTTLQSAPPQLSGPPQAPASEQSISQADDCVQSMPPPHDPGPVQVTWQGMPGGQVTS